MSKRTRDERGSVSLYWAVVIMAIFAIVGLVVDGGGKVQATQQADEIAREAARAAGEQIETSAAAGGQLTVDTAAGANAARDWLKTAGITGTVTINGATVTIDVQTVYQTKFLTAIGIPNLPVTGHAQVVATQVLAGKAR